ncbi:SDR family NAD(P)-dependent oxidoreductase [Pseudenhygromyxa sp. WMMC2535]|uniref:SDR family NAD(P)-dependent oxidoreductase n=1 Tax=Pseudenhygromyxa sp. WMMC2535 TaxID=2712867 RepID=UPI001552FAB4|nr:SDR family NAD(P)-dependent oxidoreductase [Pseudenhygromyxa sp. WMMC2535]NVB38258.1 SDR family NAD(P)-dependent oxidoreductase [Pseudenhygromyxa sp. WMMC2535]
MRLLITGATRGLGFETARILAQRGHSLILACRNKTSGDHAKDALAREGAAELRVIELDVADLDAVSRTVAALGATEALGPIDALICNAGVQLLGELTRTAQGLEQTFATNHLGHFCLARGLLGSLAAGGRIVFVSSNTHDPERWTGMPAPKLDDLRGVAEGSCFIDEPPAAAGRRRYTTSKLCNVLCARELARRLASDPRGRSAYAFDPGLMPATGLARDYGPVSRWLWHNLLPVAAKLVPNVNDVQTSARRLADLATGALDAPSGAYLSCGRVTPSSKQSLDDDLARRLWALSSELSGLPESLSVNP